MTCFSRHFSSTMARTSRYREGRDRPWEPHPTHFWPLGLLEQELVLGRLLCELEVSRLTLLPQAGLGRELVRDVARDRVLLVRVVALGRVRDGVVRCRREAVRERQGEREQDAVAPERLGEAWFFPPPSPSSVPSTLR